MRIPHRLLPLLAAATASLAIAACGSSGPKRTTAARRTSARGAEALASGVSYSRCMRSHGISRFPDPSANGGLNLDLPGLNRSAPAFKAAETACQRLLPVKRAPAGQPTAAAYARLLHWAECMRRHGISGLPDPKPDPVPGPGSPATNRFATVMGDGGYWVGIPLDANAHSPAFMHLSTRCGESPTGPAHHHH